MKIQETKGCHLFSTNSGQKFSNSYLCVAIKRTIQAFELTKSRQKHRKIRDFTVPGQVQFMELLCDKLFVGYQSCFAIYSVQGDTAPMSKLLLFLYLHISYVNPFPAIHDNSHLLNLLLMYFDGFFANNMDPNQTAPIGTV